MRLKIILIQILLILVTSISYSQKINKNYFGAWINCKLNCKLKLHQPFDSTVNIIPRFIYINNSKEVEIELRFEQKIKYRIRKMEPNTIYTDRAKILFNADTLILKDKYLGIIKFVKYYD